MKSKKGNDRMSKYKDITNQKFGKLTVIKYAYSDKRGDAYWECLCECGKISIVKGGGLRNNHTKSCGCLQKEIVSNNIGARKENTYDLSGEYGVGYGSNGKPFYFDIEDFYIINKYCWYVDYYGYVATQYNKTKFKMHDFLLNTIGVDHINRVRHDNRKSNLRKATQPQNTKNTSLRKNNTSGVIGVNWSNQKQIWRSRITNNGIQMSLGEFINLIDAIVARLNAEVKYFGEFAPQKHLFKQYGIE